MKRKNRKPRNSQRNRKKVETGKNLATNANSPKINRRDLLSTARNWGLLLILATGALWYLVDQVMATIEEHDLSRIGDGTPAIVQVHDPQCPRCLALQRETRKALKTLNEGSLHYLVANIRNSKGREFAAEHGVPHITLLLLDGNGKRRNIVRGNYKSDSLEKIFRSHVKKFGEK